MHSDCNSQGDECMTVQQIVFIQIVQQVEHFDPGREEWNGIQRQKVEKDVWGRDKSKKLKVAVTMGLE